MFRLLDIGVAQVRAPRVRRVERTAVLPGAGTRAKSRRRTSSIPARAQPAGDSRRGLPDERARRRALGARRYGLRLSPHHEQDPGGLPEGQGRGRRGHHDQLHAVRPFPTGSRSSRTSGSSARRQENRRGVHRQWRRQRSVLQGTRQPGHRGGGHSGDRLFRGRRGTVGHRHRPTVWVTWPPGTTS